MEPSLRKRKNYTEPSILPADLLLEISARTDPATLVRCAATCKALRRQIADPAFHPCLRLLHADRFVPTLLRGFFIENLRQTQAEGQNRPRFVVPGHSKDPVPEPFRSFLSRYNTLFEFHHPVVAARRGLVALRSDTTPENNEPDGACVFNLMTGYLYFFGPPGFKPQSFVLLLTADGGGADGHYRLLAAELSSGHLKTQVFSPVEHARLWQAIDDTAVDPCPRNAALTHPPIVLQGDTHWLCTSAEYHFVLGFSHEQLQASVTKIDGHCGEALRGRRPEELLLVSDGHGRQPRLLVATGLEISLWTLSDSGEAGGSWSKQVLVEPESIRLRQPGQWSERLELRWFCDRSGYVFVRLAGADESSQSWYFMLDLATGRVRGVCKVPPMDVLVFFPYELDISFWRPSFTRQLD